MTTTEVQPWDDEKRHQLHATAINVSRHSGHADRIARDNCGACALRRYTAADGPNYAGWLRVYIQLGWLVPKAHYDTEVADARTNNLQYRHAIARDIATFGITFTERKSAVDAAAVTL